MLIFCCAVLCSAVLSCAALYVYTLHFTLLRCQNSYERSLCLLPPVLDLCLPAQVRAELFDWNNHVCSGNFDVALACDVLYEHFSVEPVAHIAPQLLSPKAGMLLLADPSRRTRENRYKATSVFCAVLCYAMLCYAMLCYAMLCYAMLCYAMLHHLHWQHLSMLQASLYS